MGNIIIFSVPLPCLVSDWSAWSNMDATGMSYRTRMVTRPPINIDGECPPLIQSRKGNILRLEKCIPKTGGCLTQVAVMN